ncbi:MAG: PAS domain-containing protein [Melioribacteraceae bacterium]|nr:PAS domain-containing protein [Melioribacteraceae bacterium]
MFRTNPDGKIELANDALANMLGFDSVQEMLDELNNIKKLYKHHKDREFLIDRLAKQGFVRYYEIEANHKSGKQLWLSINAVSSLNPEGEVVYEGTMNDISERMEAEQKLKESEETFMKAFISAPYAIVLTTVEDSSIIDVNDGFVELSGFTREEVIGKITVELNMWVNEQDRLEVINDLMNGIKVRGREYRFRIKNGKEYFGFYSAELINLKNKPVIISSISDITERKIFEEKLIKSEEKFKTLAENALVAISIIDPKDVTKYLYVNKYWEEVTGYSKADIDTISPLDVVHPDMKDIVIEQAGKRIKNEISETRYELKIFTKDKKVKWLDFSSALIEYENKKALLTAGVDITDKRDTEKQLIEKVKELEKLNSFLVGRELKMVELKKEINELFSKLGERPKYTISKDENN